MPATIPFDPPIASVGLSEVQAREKTRNIRILKAGLDQNERAVKDGRADGFLKIVAHGKTGKILGAHAVGPRAEEFIVLLDLIMRAEFSLHDLTDTHRIPPLSYGDTLRQVLDQWSI